MRLLFLIPVCCFLIRSSLLSATDPAELVSRIEQVTVFKQGAQVMRLARTSIPKGRTVLRLSGLTKSFDTGSFQLKGEGDFTILSVQHQTHRSIPEVDSIAIARLTSENDTLRERIEEWNLRIQVLAEEEALILNNDKKTGKENPGLSVEELQSMAVFYRKQIGDIRLQKLQLERKKKNHQALINKKNTEINKLRSVAKPIETREVLATVQAEEATRATIKLSYLVSNAGWVPTYDLRVKDVNSPVNLIYKAHVFQQSGEEWEGIRLALSTANPRQSGTKPTLHRWNLGIYRYPTYKDRGRSEMEKLKVEEEVLADEMDRSTTPVPSKPLAITTTTKTTSVEFEIEEPYTIKKDGKKYMVSIKELDIPAYYEYYAAPKLDESAFLTAMITNWEDYDLLSGKTNLYFEGTFLGSSVIQVESLKDTMHLSLGRDPNIVVERTLQKDYSKTTFLRNKKVEDKSYKIKIRNKKNSLINLVLEDHFPISTTSEIEIKYGVYTGADLNRETGILKWRFQMASKATEEVTFDYSVKYPSTETVLLE